MCTSSADAEHVVDVHIQLPRPRHGTPEASAHHRSAPSSPVTERPQDGESHAIGEFTVEAPPRPELRELGVGLTVVLLGLCELCPRRLELTLELCDSLSCG